MYKENENVTHRVICKWSSKILTRSSFLLRRARYKHFQAKASSVTILRKQSANLTSESSVRNPKWRSLKNIRVFTSYVFVAISPTKVPSVRSYWHNLFYTIVLPILNKYFLGNISLSFFQKFSINFLIWQSVWCFWYTKKINRLRFITKWPLPLLVDFDVDPGRLRLDLELLDGVLLYRYWLRNLFSRFPEESPK